MKGGNRTRRADDAARWLAFAPSLAALLLAGVAALLLAGDAAAAQEGLSLVPPLEMFLTLLVLFSLLVFPVNALIFRPILAALDAREAKIGGTRSRAEKIEADAEEALARYEASVREVREDAERDRKERLAEVRGEATKRAVAARADAEREIERARATLSIDLEQARESLRAQAQGIAREAAERVLGRSLS